MCSSCALPANKIHSEVIKFLEVVRCMRDFIGRITCETQTGKSKLIYINIIDRQEAFIINKQ